MSSKHNLFKPVVEALEDRAVPAVSLQLTGTTLNITGDARHDTVNLYEYALTPGYFGTSQLVVTWKDDLGKSGGGSYYLPGLSKIVFHGNDGNDTLTNVLNPDGLPFVANPYVGLQPPPLQPMFAAVPSKMPRVEAYGDAGVDTLRPGSCQGSVLVGGAGNDTLYGGAGDDRYVFDNVSIGGGSLGVDTINEAPDRGADMLDFFGKMNHGVNVDLGITTQQQVNQLLALKLSSGSAIENVEGTYYDDMIRGNALDNYLYGSDANDTLYGRDGNDTLDGGAGNDGLFGGRGVNNLYGGGGADRFLVQDYLKIDPYAPPQIQDIVHDSAPKDATILFKMMTKSWTTSEIEQVDKAFSILHKATGNTKLLKLCSGNMMTFNRLGAIAAGYNSNGNIVLTDYVMNGLDGWVIGYSLHEIGHNWDTESPVWKSFLALSGWTQTDPKSTAYTQITRYGETWWFKTSAPFASSYAKTHPVEDFAESFSAYFLQKAGLPWYGLDGSGASAIPAKVNLIGQWVNSL